MAVHHDRYNRLRIQVTASYLPGYAPASQSVMRVHRRTTPTFVCIGALYMVLSYGNKASAKSVKRSSLSEAACPGSEAGTASPIR